MFSKVVNYTLKTYHMSKCSVVAAVYTLELGNFSATIYLCHIEWVDQRDIDY